MSDELPGQWANEQERLTQVWWESLSEYQRINLAVRAAGGDTPSDGERELIYAAEKPWKWRDDAYRLHLAAEKESAG